MIKKEWRTQWVSQTKASYVSITQNKALFQLITEAPLKTEIIVKQKMVRKPKKRWIILQCIIWYSHIIYGVSNRTATSHCAHLATVTYCIHGSSSDKHWVISCQVKCRTEASLFLPVTTTVSKRPKLQIVWGSSHILLSFPFLTYTFQSQPPAQRRATESEHSLYHCRLSSSPSQTWWKKVFHLVILSCVCFSELKLQRAWE